MTTHHLDDMQPHAFWDNAHPPRLRIQPGDTVVFETLEGGGQVTQEWSAADLAHWDRNVVHALTGPVYVEDAEPGDVLVVEIIDLQHKGWGWNCVFPNFGLLAGEFSEPYIHHYKLVGSDCEFRPDIHIPFEPFCGVMGVAPAEPGRLRTSPPRANAGNVDIRHLTPGTTVFLPVLVPGALFSCGDCHAAQGDGEINGTGIESPMTVTLRFDLQKDRSIPELCFRTPPGRKLTVADAAGYFVTTAHGPDLYQNAQQAARYMLDHLVVEYGMSREEAYCLTGTAVDLKISEIVDRPNWIVAAYLPLSIFRSA
ncbi:MAG: acetamidase/formamidase family protein [Armatimonadota bacterium]